MRQKKLLIAGALLSTFVIAMAVGLLWPSPATAAPPCSACENGELRCISSCYATYPNDPIARSQCIDGCFDSWLWCYEICI